MNFLLGQDWFQGMSKFYALFIKKFSKYISLGVAVLIAIAASFLFFSTKAVAIDAIKIKYGAVDVSVTVTELVTFANTGQASNQLQSLFQIAKATPDQIKTVREILNRQVKVNPNFLNEVLNSYYGKLVVTEVSKYITAGSDVARTVDDVKAAINTSLADGQLTGLELLQNYQGINAIVIDGEKVLNIYNQLVREGEKIIAYLRNEPEVQRVLCKT